MNNLESELLSKIKRGDREAFNKLFEDHFESLCRYAFLLVRDETSAEEIVTEVFYRLWCKRNEIHIRVSVNKYLLKSVYNVSLNYLKHIGIVKHYKDLNIVMHKEKEIFADDYNTSPLALLEFDELEASINDAIEKPFKELQDSNRILPCQGFFNLEMFVNKLKAIGYDKWISLELFNQELWEKDPYNVANDSMNSLKKLL